MVAASLSVGKAPLCPSLCFKDVCFYVWRNLIVSSLDGNGIADAHTQLSFEMVLPSRIELPTSALPKQCSTTELRQQRAAYGIGAAGWQVG